MSEAALLPRNADFGAWRHVARTFLARGVKPGDIVWSGEGDLFSGAPAPACDAPITVSRAFIDLAQDVILHREPARFALLYQILWRLQKDRALLANAADADVYRAGRLAKAVRQDVHHMHAFVRFRRVETEERERFIAWYEPDHYIVAAAAPFFVERFYNLRWSILTPEKSAHWDGVALAISAGVSARPPAKDAVEESWRAYYAAMFNPARVNLAATRRQMPVRHWRNLPEATLVGDLVHDAPARAAAMVKAAPSAPRKRAGAAHAALHAGEDALADIAARGVEPQSLKDIRAALDACRACPLWANSTQGVPGEGPARAPLMLVGEQPGDSEDLAGKPFVGPAGQVLNAALEEAGIERGEIFVTNAVKHFKNEPRGKRRLHKRPNPNEIEVCKWWLDHEIKIVRPQVIVALGATAMFSLAHFRGTLSSVRGRAMDWEGAAKLVPTIHPSSILRIPDRAAKAEARANLIADLKSAKRLLS